MRFHSYYTDNLPEQIQIDHQRCAEKFGIEIVYHKDKFISVDAAYTAHGNCLTQFMTEDPEDVVCFLDLDCLIYNLDTLKKVFEWVKYNKSFAGNAQNISHTVTKNRLYAAASMLIIHKEAWNYLGRPDLAWSMQGGIQIDTAQSLSLKADEVGFNYQLLYPIGYDGDRNTYRLGTYGQYGTGTMYPGSWHYFRISDFHQDIPELWTNRVNNILNQELIVPKNISYHYA
ncbi:MAG: hypothetical protein ACKO7N_01570 [Candidatus Nitrosotenuis sp.]